MANKKIQGITIEIGGNTTKLQDALKGVDKQVFSLNSDLKSLNQALKLDPKNTELLAQKQDVLARNISATKDRLETLKEAQRQMGDYNKLTDEQKESYNQLSLEIAKSESALKDMQKELKATSGIDMSKLKDGLKKVGDVALEVTKKLGQVSAVVGGALAGLVTAGVKSYAALEQNVGGILTLFGNGGTTLEEYAENNGKTIAQVEKEWDGLQKAQMLAMDKASQAYSSAGLSANQYMETVTSFAASLKQSMKNADPSDIVRAADQAVIDMADNANKMGTDMSAIQSAYQGFAKQNYTMLDNLKLGYGGTKTEMERLLKDAEKFSGQKYDIKNLNDVYSAIHVIQEELGIAGATADEAATTISGSASAMKAAFDNFINGSGSPEQLAEAFSTFAINVGTAFANLLPQIVSGLTTLFSKLAPLLDDMLWELLPQIIEAISGLLTAIFNFITNNQQQISQTITMVINEIIMFISQNLPSLIQAGIDILMALVNGIIGALPTLAAELPKLISTILEVLITNIPVVLDGAIQLLLAIVQAIPVIIQALVAELPSIIDITITTLLDNLPMLLEGAIQLFMAIVQAIPIIIVQLVKLAPTIITNIVKTLWNNRGKILEVGKKLLMTLKDGIVSYYSTLWGIIKKIPTTIKEKIEEGFSKIKEIGTNIVKGIMEGITNSLDWIKERLKDWVGNVTKFLKKIFKIGSPSKLMADEIGWWLGEGVGVGFEEAMGAVEKDMAKSIPIDSLVSNVDNAMRGLQYGINSSINPQINPNITYEQNYELMSKAMKDALNDMEIALDDREVGKFVSKTITEEIYGGTL